MSSLAASLLARRAQMAVFIVLSCSASTIWAQSSHSAAPRIADLLEQSKFEQALHDAQHELKAHPGDCPVATLEAIALTKLDRKKEALLAFRTAVTRCPTYLPALEGAAELEYASADESTPDTLRKLIRVDPGNAIAHAMLGVLLQNKQDYGGAIAEFRASGSYLDTRPDLVQDFGLCLIHEGQYEAALQAFQHLASVSKNPELLYDIALLQWKLGSTTDAIGTLSPLIDARYVPALGLAAGIKEEQGDTPSAVALLRAAITAAPQDESNYLDFAVISFRHSSFDAGIAMLDAGIAQLPRSARLLVARSVLEIQKGKNDEALADLRKSHEIEPSLSIVSDALGMLHVQERDENKGIALFRAQAALHPDDAFLQFLLAEQLYLSIRSDRDPNLFSAIEAAKLATRIRPDYTAAHDLLSQLYLRSGQLDLAVDEAHIASLQDPHDEAAVYQELRATRRQGNDAETKRLVEKLLSVRKQNQERRQMVDKYKLFPEASP